MKLSEQLYSSVKELWDGYYCHPFVAGIGDGTLPMEKFRFYMLQDYLYLYDYAKVFALGVVKARDHSLMRFFSEQVNATLHGEMNIHHTYMERLGITEDEVSHAQMSLANKSYTKYMLEVGYSEGVLELLVSILSCAWSYQKIGEVLSKIPGAMEHEFYGEWIQGYASTDYQKATQEILDMVDQLGAEASTQTVEHLIEIFISCSRYEMMFWDMSYNMEA